MRGIILSAYGANADPENEVHGTNISTLLKKAAEHFRMISKSLKDEVQFQNNSLLLAKFDEGMITPSPQTLTTMLNKGASLISTAIDRFITKASPLVSDEKALLEVIGNSVKLLNSLQVALNSGNMFLLLTTTLEAANNISQISEMVFPMLDTCYNEFLKEDVSTCVVNIIRCGIQLKLMAAIISSWSGEFESEELIELRYQCAFLGQLWGAYSNYLLDGVYKVTHLL